MTTFKKRDCQRTGHAITLTNRGIEYRRFDRSDAGQNEDVSVDDALISYQKLFCEHCEYFIVPTGDVSDRTQE